MEIYLFRYYLWLGDKYCHFFKLCHMPKFREAHLREAHIKITAQKNKSLW